MKIFCLENNITYVNLDQRSIGENGIVLESLKNKNPFDHHYDIKAHAKLIIRDLKKVL